MNEHLGFYLGDCGRLMRKRFDIATRHMGVTGAQWRVLMILERMPGINQGQLAERLEVEPITTCRMVDRLEQAGFVERRRDPQDRRAWQIFLKDAAMPLMDELHAISEEVRGQLLSTFTDEEHEQFKSLLLRLRTNLLADPDELTQEASNG